MEDIRELHEQTGRAWEQAARQEYAPAIERDIAFLREGGTNFCRPEYRYLVDLKSWCRRAIHLQCAGGRDTLSLWNLGAREVVGVDISIPDACLRPRQVRCPWRPRHVDSIRHSRDAPPARRHRRSGLHWPWSTVLDA